MAGDVLTRKDWPGRWHMGPCGDSGLSPQGNGALLRGFTKQGDDMIILAFRKGSSWPLSGEAWEGGRRGSWGARGRLTQLAVREECGWGRWREAGGCPR